MIVALLSLHFFRLEKRSSLLLSFLPFLPVFFLVLSLSLHVKGRLEKREGETSFLKRRFPRTSIPIHFFFIFSVVSSSHNWFIPNQEFIVAIGTMNIKYTKFYLCIHFGKYLRAFGKRKVELDCEPLFNV